MTRLVDPELPTGALSDPMLQDHTHVCSSQRVLLSEGVLQDNKYQMRRLAHHPTITTVAAAGDAAAQQQSTPQHGQTLDSSIRRSSLCDAAAPPACSSFSDPGTSMLPITQHPSFRRPMEEVVLRIECAGDRSVRVRLEWILTE